MKKKMIAGMVLIVMSIAGTALAAVSTYPDASQSVIQYAQDDTHHHMDKDKCCKDDDTAK